MVEVKAAGLNFPDVLMIQGKYQYQPEMPFIPGGECAGVVTAVGDKVSRYKVGDRVIAVAGTGAFSEQVVANEFGTFPMPDRLSFEQAAGVSITYFTSYYALKQRAQLREGETLLVLGAAGGVGATAVELGKLMGAKVIAAASSDEKLALCKQLGADELINYSEAKLKDAVKELTGGKGVDVIYDPVGGDYAEPAVRSMGWNGRYLVIGFASGPIPEIPLNLALLKGCSIVGVFWGHWATMNPEAHVQNIREMVGLLTEQKLTPRVTASYALEDYVQAYSDVAGRRITGKTVFKLR